jgi:biotin carboxylase
MPRLLLLLPSTTYRGEAFLDAARRLNVQVTVGSESGLTLPVHSVDAYLPLELRQPESASRTALEYAKRHRIDAVIGVDDATVVTAAAIAAALGLPHNPIASVTAAHNKFRMRELLCQHGMPVPRYVLCPLEADPASVAESVRYPCVVKPLVLSASCGVIRANDPAECAAALCRVAGLLRRLGLTATDEGARHLLVEEFIPGPELAVEGLLTDGALIILALFDKPDPLEGPFFEETIYVTPSRQPAVVQTDIAACVQRATAALGLREGPVHAEVRVNEGGVWVIEVAARSIGGRCSRILRFASGLSLEELLVRHALRLGLPSLERERQAAGVMMVPIPSAGMLREVRGQEEALAVPGIEEVDITAEPGQELVPLPEGTRYLGFLLARGDSPESVEAALREAHRRLQVEIEEVSPAPGLNRTRSSQAQVIRF